MWIKSIGTGRVTLSDLFGTVGISKFFNVQFPLDTPARNLGSFIQIKTNIQFED